MTPDLAQVKECFEHVKDRVEHILHPESEAHLKVAEKNVEWVDLFAKALSQIIKREMQMSAQLDQLIIDVRALVDARLADDPAPLKAEIATLTAAAAAAATAAADALVVTKERDDAVAELEAIKAKLAPPPAPQPQQ